MRDDANETALQEAQRLVYGDRQGSYGHPADDYECTAGLWDAMLRSHYKPFLRELALAWYWKGRIDESNGNARDRFSVADLPPLGPRLACLMMVGVKLSREVRQHKRDNCVDGAGYFECVNRIARREAGEE